ncbi:DedA family protein [Polymorphospora sp. NPDC051019]|uniref:DedA family protein n=1 Tax=Polymorphospora sp. NPDC051019 TaxID=3155725 RepID=UPI00342CEB44
MTELLTASPTWAYLALLGLLAVDAVVPVVPTQAVMITGGALTVYGQLDLRLTILVGAAGMFAGDLACYLLGRWTPAGARLPALRRPRQVAPAGAEPLPAGTQPSDGDTTPLLGAARRWARARRAASRFGRGLRRPGPLVILICRFVPGGRMAACFHAGRARYPARLFVTYDAAAALGWAAYGGFVGHVGGSALTQSAWRLLVVAALAAVVFAGAGWALALADPAGRRAAAAAGPGRPGR